MSKSDAAYQQGYSRGFAFGKSIKPRSNIPRAMNVLLNSTQGIDGYEDIFATYLRVAGFKIKYSIKKGQFTCSN